MPTTNKTQIQVETPMLAAFHSGLREYQPIFRQEKLALEHNDHFVSSANLAKIVAKGHQVRDLIANGNGYSILVIFDTGEEYLATGFAYGSDADDARVAALAKVSSKYLGGSAKSWLDFLKLEQANTRFYKGRLVAPPEPNHDGDDGYEPALSRDGLKLHVASIEAD